MARSEHNRQAYAQLFGYVGGALQVFSVVLILASFLVVPIWAGVLMLVIAVGLGAYSWMRYRANFMMPTIAGIIVATMWMTLVGIGFGLLGWSP